MPKLTEDFSEKFREIMKEIAEMLRESEEMLRLVAKDVPNPYASFRRAATGGERSLCPRCLSPLVKVEELPEHDRILISSVSPRASYVCFRCRLILEV